MRFSQNSVFHILPSFFGIYLWFFVLIFDDFATLMGRSVLSRGFLKSAFFGPVTMATYLGTPTYFFNILCSKKSLYWLYSACKVWKSLDSLFLRYPFWKDFGTVVFRLNFRQFELFYFKKYVFSDTMVYIHCFTVQKKNYYDYDWYKMSVLFKS